MRQSSPERNVPVTGIALGHLLGYAETIGLLCSGVPRGPRREHTYALLEERAPGRRRLERDEALAEVARRYALGHGPVTERDLTYWATLTLADVRRGLVSASDDDPSIRRVDVDGTTYWCKGEPVLDVPRPTAHLLHIFDEAYRGYQDSRAVIDGEQLMGKGREGALGMLLVEGQILGTFKRTTTAREVRLDAQLWRAPRDHEESALGEAAHRFGSWLGRETVLRLTLR